MQASGVEARDVVLVPQEQDARDDTLELRDGAHRLRDRAVKVRRRVAVGVPVPVERRQAAAAVPVAGALAVVVGLARLLLSGDELFLRV